MHRAVSHWKQLLQLHRCKTVTGGVSGGGEGGSLVAAGLGIGGSKPHLQMTCRFLTWDLERWRQKSSLNSLAIQLVKTLPFSAGSEDSIPHAAKTLKYKADTILQQIQQRL